MPGCLGLDAMWQLMGFFFGWMGVTGRGHASGVAEVKFRGQVKPQHLRVTYRIHITRISLGEAFSAMADAVMACDGAIIYEVRDLHVGMLANPTLHIGIAKEPA